MVPVGFKRSRALWDEARRPHATRTETVKAYLAAIAYELQPIRLSESNKQQVIDGFKKFLQNLVHVVQGLPSVAKTVFSFVTTRSFREWLVAGGVLVYYFFVRWVHGVLDAGPLVVILTALTLIFTIGLSDEKREGLSAYSIFNRGFERLMGSVDVDALLAQHVGGGIGGGAMMNHEEDQHDNNANVNHRRQEARQGNQENQLRNDDDNDHGREDQERNNNGDNNNNRARKSGKKARRRNLEQRRDLRHQREAALQMGLDGTEGPQEMMAMQRLIEEQIAAENNNG